MAIAGPADAAEAGDVSGALQVDRLVLSMAADPGDDDVVLVSENQVHAPVSVEAPLADSVVVARLGAHARSAGRTSTMAKFLDDALETLLGLAAQLLDSRRTAARYGDLEPRSHARAVGREGTARSDLYSVASESVLQALACSWL